jgi:hypothetical protein
MWEAQVRGRADVKDHVCGMWHGCLIDQGGCISGPISCSSPKPTRSTPLAFVSPLPSSTIQVVPSTTTSLFAYLPLPSSAQPPPRRFQLPSDRQLMHPCSCRTIHRCSCLVPPAGGDLRPVRLRLGSGTLSARHVDWRGQRVWRERSGGEPGRERCGGRRAGQRALGRTFALTSLRPMPFGHAEAKTRKDTATEPSEARRPADERIMRPPHTTWPDSGMTPSQIHRPLPPMPRGFGVPRCAK